MKTQTIPSPAQTRKAGLLATHCCIKLPWGGRQVLGEGPKAEARKPKESRKPKPETERRERNLGFRSSDLFRISDFGASDFHCLPRPNELDAALLPTRFSRVLVFLLLLGSVGAFAAEIKPRIVPLIRAHAHNDYEHSRPLLDALDQGFCSVEADVHLVNGKLLVAHDLKDARPERTLESLYLEPLRQRARQNGGHIYVGGATLTLLVDVKSEAAATYEVLDAVLRNFTDILTRFESGRMEPRAVIVVVSGNRARELLEKQTIRYAALDGRLPDLEGTAPKELVPLISEDWQKFFSWRGAGSLPADQEKRLVQIVAQAHQQGRKVRFWGTPDDPNFWRVLSAAGVDLINADDLVGLRQFLGK